MNAIDRLIAEKVMGWQAWDHAVPYYVTTEGFEVSSEDFRPSRNLEHAWKVFEKMEKQFTEVRISKNWGYRCQILLLSTGVEYKVVGQKDAETAPLAICRAALMAVGQEVLE